MSAAEDWSASISAITLGFELSEKARDLGAYEMFVEIPRKLEARIHLNVPKNHGIPRDGVMLFELHKDADGVIMPSPAKRDAVGWLGDGGDYGKIFTGDLPGDFKLINHDDGTATLEDHSNTPGEYDYLVWIKKPDPSDPGDPSKATNTFADPGVRNR